MELQQTPTMSVMQREIEANSKIVDSKILDSQQQQKMYKSH